MKKTYATPTIVTCGDIATETKSTNAGQEIGGPVGMPAAPGSVGFYL